MAQKTTDISRPVSSVARLAVLQILLRLLDAMEANRPGAALGEEVERLHDLRVAVRRTRAALGQFREVLPAEALEHFRGEFRWVGSLSGPLRDLDVYLQHFASCRDALPAAYREELVPLEALLRDRRQTAQRRLAQAVSSRRYRALVKQWRRFLTDTASDETLPPDAQMPMAALAGRRIRKLFRRVLKSGRKIGTDSPAADLHALRILCKKLRYLLEFSAEYYEPKRVELLVAALKALQDNLGAFQDLTVQIRALAGFAEELAAAGTPVRTLLAMGMLIEHLERQRRKVRKEFASSFTRFSRKRNRTLFKDLFADAAAEKAARRKNPDL
ncbi:MAG TPA: CHAD domain-containing protein, partial [Desulfuromonadales bacterium]|nr:CHAD domain-containing protein [Desulfuromonadales bacterium]